jgi:hypothetical protein
LEVAASRSKNNCCTFATSSQFCCHTITYFACLILYQTTSNKQPVLVPHHFQQAAIFVVTLFASLEQAAIFTTTPLSTDSKQLFLVLAAQNSFCF